MPRFLDTRGYSDIAIAICDRCRMKRPHAELQSDPNFPGLQVCAQNCKDQFDPYRLVARHLTDVGTSNTTRLRVLVDMNSYAGAGNPEGLLRYEAACHAAMQAYAGRVVVLAQYRYGDLPGDTVIGMLRLHPSTVVAQYVRRNPNPADPVAFMARLLHRTSP